MGILVYEMLAGYPPFFDENSFGIYQKILLGKVIVSQLQIDLRVACILTLVVNQVEYPRHFDMQAKDLIRKLLQPDRSKRMGNLKGGADDVRKHKW